jgi:hypothetical protein
MRRLAVRGMAVLCLTCLGAWAAEQRAGRITLVEGKVSVLRAGGADWIAGRPAMPLSKGDQVYAREESFAEIVCANGAIVRLGEKTKVTIAEASDKSVETRSGIGNVWVNMRKLMGNEARQFELSTPTATAAIRGTAFNTTTRADSSSDVAVYEGKVAVGPGEGRAGKTPGGGAEATAPVEVPGPEEVPGPYEVSLQEWKSIVAGQRISVRNDGKFAQEEFDTAAAARTDAFVKKNRQMDAAGAAVK